jgi:hypothetical protein
MEFGYLKSGIEQAKKLWKNQSAFNANKNAAEIISSDDR